MSDLPSGPKTYHRPRGPEPSFSIETSTHQLPRNPTYQERSKQSPNRQHDEVEARTDPYLIARYLQSRAHEEEEEKKKKKREEEEEEKKKKEKEKKKKKKREEEEEEKKKKKEKEKKFCLAYHLHGSRVSSDGRVTSQSSLAEAIKQDSSILQDLRMDEKKEDPLALDEKDVRRDGAGKLIVAEEIQTGRVRWPAMKLYFSNFGGVPLWSLVMFSLVIVACLNMLQTWFLGRWARQYALKPPNQVNVSWYLAVYAGYIIVVTTIAWFSSRFGSNPARPASGPRQRGLRQSPSLGS